MRWGSCRTIANLSYHPKFLRRLPSTLSDNKCLTTSALPLLSDNLHALQINRSHVLSETFFASLRCTTRLRLIWGPDCSDKFRMTKEVAAVLENIVTTISTLPALT